MSSSNGDSKHPMSLLDIQAEQAASEQKQHKSQQNSRQQQQQQQFGRNNNAQRGGGGGPSGRNNSRGGGGGGRGRNNRVNVADMPLEQGVIRSLKDSFGFIRGAQRPDDVFFPFAEVVGDETPTVDTEVQFRIGKSDRDRVQAFKVEKLPPGTIKWETAVNSDGQRVQGLIDRAGRSGVQGIIKTFDERDAEENEKDGATRLNATGPRVRFSLKDVKPTKVNDRSYNVTRGDLVDFELYECSRTKEFIAKEIELIQTESDRLKKAKEQERLSSATVEHGVITSLKGEYGFLKSSSRREIVYFHYSHVHLDPDGEHGDTQDDFVLQEGQDVKFLVVDDSDGRYSARKLITQPRGSVIFHHTIKRGVTGKVIQCPQPVDATHALEHFGKISLTEPLTHTDINGQEQVINEVYLTSQDSPGGLYSFHHGEAVGLWIEVGDLLLFDIVQDKSDGAFRAAPTSYLLPPTDKGDETDDDEDDSDELPAIRLLQLTLAMRSEGVINKLKDDFGFMHYAERTVDVHFRLYQVLPDNLQNDLRRYMGLSNNGQDGKQLSMTTNVEASFDLSVHGTINSHGSGRKRSNIHERENLKAQRIMFLPPGTIQWKKVLASDMTATVIKVDPQSPYIGTLDLSPPVTGMSLEERHPLIAKMITEFLQANDKKPIVYRDVQSGKEDAVVIAMLEKLGDGKLAYHYVPMPGLPAYKGRLCITKVVDSKVDELAETDKSKESVEGVSGAFRNGKRPANLLPKELSTIRYEKNSLITELKTAAPPNVGDVCCINIVHFRRSNQINVEDMRITERKEPAGDYVPPSEAAQPGSCKGVVSEVNSGRRFGYIVMLDENSGKQEQVFFNLSSVVKKKGAPVSQGDEVTFDIEVDKKGKSTARNVMITSKGSGGGGGGSSIRNQADKEACKGIVLLEPSHTTIKHGTLRHAGSATSQKSDKGQGGRWSSVEDDRNNRNEEESKTDMGCILLLEDNAKLFSTQSSALSDDDNKSVDNDADTSATGGLRRLLYKNSAIATSGKGSSGFGGSNNPRRGDLVSFSKKKSAKGVCDVRLVTRNAATLQRGRLEEIKFDSEDSESGTAKFIAANESEDTYDVSLSEVVGCNVKSLKDKESVEGIIHNGAVYGISRTVDLYLESKIIGNSKERPKLNLTVKKDRGGKIIAQSMMAKGPDGTNGFEAGWTKRQSKYTDIAKNQLNEDAKPWVPP